MSRHQNFNVVDLIHKTTGSSDSLEEIFEQNYPDMDWMADMTEEELKYFDSRVFQCQSCGWWFTQDERDEENENEWTCKDCK